MTERRATVEQLIAFLAGDNPRIGNWPKLVEAAGETLTIGILAERALARTELGAPATILDLLADVRERARKRNALIRRQFLELAGALNRAGIEPLPMKGLARLLRSSKDECRLLSDIDILIPSERRDECIAAMHGLGYTAIEEGDALESSVFARPQDVGAVDLHMQLKPYFLEMNYEFLTPLCAREDIGGAFALLPSPTCEALMLIAHDQLHDADYWRGLVDVRHLLDLDELAGAGVDWAALLQMLPAGSPRRAAQLALLTVRRLLGSTVPAAASLGRWAQLQLARRRLQARFPALKDALTLLTIALDPPPVSPLRGTPEEAKTNWWGKLAQRLEKYLGPDNPGKISIGLPGN